MKIIKTGSNKPKETKRKCLSCKTVFTFVSTDVKYDRDGSYVNCPCCKAFIST